VNGKPGDNPYTDIIVHDLTVFSPEVDALVRQVDGLGGFDSLLARHWLFLQQWLIDQQAAEDEERREYLHGQMRLDLQDEVQRLTGGQPG
jgi:hypothetical protein